MPTKKVKTKGGVGSGQIHQRINVGHKRDRKRANVKNITVANGKFLNKRIKRGGADINRRPSRKAASSRIVVANPKCAK